MKEKVIKVLSIAVLAGLLATGAAIMLGNTVQAYRGDYTKTGPNHNEERKKAMETIMKNKDFEAWKKLMTENGKNPRILRVIDTKEEFDKFAQVYEFIKAGKIEEANKIRTELGLGNKNNEAKKQKKRNFLDANNDGVCDRR